MNKGEAVKTARHVPYRLLQGVKNLSYGDADTENMLIQGDNLEALKALLPLYAGKVKCIYIDPPYNTKSAFEHYGDNLEHSQWLCMMFFVEVRQKVGINPGRNPFSRRQRPIWRDECCTARCGPGPLVALSAGTLRASGITTTGPKFNRPMG